jgi:hypothetical protein
LTRRAATGVPRSFLAAGWLRVASRPMRLWWAASGATCTQPTGKVRFGSVTTGKVGSCYNGQGGVLLQWATLLQQDNR